MKQLLRPFIKFMDRLSYRRKLVVSAVIFLVPILAGLMFSLYSTHVKSQMARQELAGLDFMLALKPLLIQIPQFRGMLHVVLNSDETFKGNLLAKQKQIDRIFESYSSMENQRLLEWGLGKEFAAITAAWQEVKNNAAGPKDGMSDMEVFDQQSRLVESLHSFFAKIGEATMLIRDHDLHVHRITDNILFKLPHLMEYIGNSRGLGAGAIARKYISHEEHHEFVSLASLIRINMTSLKANVEFCNAENFSHKAYTQANLTLALEKTEEFLNILRDEVIWASETEEDSLLIKMDPARYFAAGTDAIAGYSALFDNVGALIRLMLIKRMERHSMMITIQCLIAAVGLLLLFCIFSGLYFSMVDSMLVLKDSAERIAQGWFGQKIILSARDESAAVADSFNLMSEKLDHYFSDLTEKEKSLRIMKNDLEAKNRQLMEEIRERLGAENSLLKSEKNFRNLVEGLLTGILIVNDGVILYKNQEQSRLFSALNDRFDSGQLGLTHRCERLFQHQFDLIRSGRKKSAYMELEKARQGSLHERRWVFCLASSMEYQDNNAVLFNMMDATEAKKLERMVMVQDKMSSLGRVAAGIAHEIRNPLSTINVALNTFTRNISNGNNNNGMPANTPQAIDRMQKAVGKIESVIRRVMDFTKAGTLQRRQININDCIRDSVELCAITLRKQGIGLETELSGIAEVFADQYAMEQVLVNLLTNGAEAMADWNGEKRILISSAFCQNALEESSIAVTVADSGPGITDDEAEKIFEPFYTTKSFGSGIGLNICQRIVSDHQGTITTGKSKLSGCAMTVTIPVSPAGEQP